MKKCRLIYIPIYFYLISLFACNSISENSDIQINNLDSGSVANLFILGKVWGYLKYYHPDIRAGIYDWDAELFQILPTILRCKNSNERNNMLSSWIKRFKIVEITQRIQSDHNAQETKSPLIWLRDTILLGNALSEQLLSFENIRRSDSAYYVVMEPDTLYPIFIHEKEYFEKVIPDVGLRLLSLYRYWNIVEYFYPYKYLMNKNWDSVLFNYIPKLVFATNELLYKKQLLSLFGELSDTHVKLFEKVIGLSDSAAITKYVGFNLPAFSVRFVDEAPIIYEYPDEDYFRETKLELGDKILKINGRRIIDIIDEKAFLAPASNHAAFLRKISSLLLRTNDKFLTIEYQRDKIINTTIVKCYSFGHFAQMEKLKELKSKSFNYFKKQILYINPKDLSKLSLMKELAYLSNYKAIIIDLRYYPSNDFVEILGDYLIPKPTPFAKIYIGNIRSPGTFSFSNTYNIGKFNRDYFKGKVILIINERTQSQGEYTAMALRCAPNAITIGSTTAGTDGDVSSINLPGGVTTYITGNGVFYPDGKQTQRIGIIPDIVSKPTISGIKNGKDELLNKAIELANSH
jgi:C-terminal processing protease CtpA/Prc